MTSFHYTRVVDFDCIKVFRQDICGQEIGFEFPSLSLVTILEKPTLENAAAYRASKLNLASQCEHVIRFISDRGNNNHIIVCEEYIDSLNPNKTWFLRFDYHPYEGDSIFSIILDSQLLDR